MKKIYLNLCIFLGVLVSVTHVHAQAQISITAKFFPDTAYFNLGYNVGVTVKNVSAQPFTGVIHIFYQTDTTMLYPVELDSMNVTLDASGGINDSVSIYKTAAFIILQTEFHPGTNIVVVWPTSSGIMTVDSLKFNIYVPDGLGILESNTNNENILFYPNPATDILYFKQKNGQRKIETMRVIDCLGKVVKTYTGNISNSISVKQLETGMYFIETTTSDGNKYMQRLIKK